jgi:hypothetical protein
MFAFSMSATTTQLLSSGEFCKLRYATIPGNSAPANVSFNFIFVFIFTGPCIIRYENHIHDQRDATG